MKSLSVFGSLDLRGPDGEAIDSVLSQPKRCALLAYLAVARPRGFHRRDTLLGLFWPESDAEQARAAAEIFEELGNPEMARHHYGRLVTYWNDADDELKLRVEHAQRRIEALSGER